MKPLEVAYSHTLLLIILMASVSLDLTQLNCVFTLNVRCDGVGMQSIEYCQLSEKLFVLSLTLFLLKYGDTILHFIGTFACSFFLL